MKLLIKLQRQIKNDKSDDGEGLDAVQPKAVKKKFKDRKDKDIDNDGDTDSSDKYLHKRRKAISKASEDYKSWLSAILEVRGLKIKEEVEEDGRQLKDPKKEMMVVKDKAVIVIDKKDWKKYEKKGYTQAEENETTDTGKKRAKVEINPSAEDSSD